MPGEEPLLVFYDGACGLCRRAREGVEPLDTGRRLAWRDFRDPAAREGAPFTEEDLAREMAVRLPDGTWRRGFEAWRAVLLLLPRRRWLGRVLGVFPFRALGPSIYRAVARRRFLLSRMLGPPASCPRGSCGRPGSRSR